MRRLFATSLFLLVALPLAAQQEADLLQETPPPKVNPLSFTPSPSDTPATEKAVEEFSANTPDEKLDQVRELMQAETVESPSTDSGATTGDATAGDADSGDDSLALGPAFLQGMMALCGTLALFLLLLAAVKRWGRRTPLLASHSLGEVMGRIALSPQASLHFIRVKNEVLVVGVTQQSVALLRSMDADLFDQPVKEELPATSGGAEPIDFLTQLQASRADLSKNPGAFDEELDSLKGDLQRLKRYFQDSAREQD